MTLADLQQWTQHAITSPIATAASAHIETAQRLDPDECLTIYRRAYRARLLQFFELTFPCLLYALGQERFESFVEGYLCAHPPNHYSIDRAADAFPGYLAATRPPNESWPDFIIGLAQLELEALRVFDGPGIEDTNAPTAATTAAITTGHAVFVRSPALRILSLAYPVHVYRKQFQRGANPALPAPHECVVALTRRNYRVAERELSRDQHALLEGLHRNTPVAIASLSMEERRWLCDWAGLGFFQAIHVSDSEGEHHDDLQ